MGDGGEEEGHFAGLVLAVGTVLFGFSGTRVGEVSGGDALVMVLGWSWC